MPPEEWLYHTVKKIEEEFDNQLHIPKRDDGKSFNITSLYPDQKQVVGKVMDKLLEWLTCDDLGNFKPLRMTINGAGGSGKSVVINTIVSLMRRMFGINDVVRVVAPTGTAAFNVNGETFHHLLGNTVTRRHYTPYSMSKEKRLKLVKKFGTLLALIVDERSLINSKDLGTAEQQISETIFGGGLMSDESFGGLPIVILVGDDYQLPGTDEGAFVALDKKGGTKMTQRGRSALLECANLVMDLQGSKRMSDKKQKQKELVARLRIGANILDEDVEKLLSLHLSNSMEKRHPKAVIDAIKKDAIYLYYTNEKRIRKNLERLAEVSGPDNPVAMLRPQSTGPSGGKGISKHFENQMAETSKICIGAKVAIDSRNFCPMFGLHSGACGTVDEIVFKKGENPNNGDLPLYVVVDFPLYCGPAWDTKNPTVS